MRIFIHTRIEDCVPSLSIVIPTYNVEKYLVKCVKSVCNQTLEDIEIIVVDDGSTDSSGRIADELTYTDSRIKVIHQVNSGLGPARNTGIDTATGDYVGFVDSDDWVEPDMFEGLLAEAKRHDADVCACGFKTVSDEYVRGIYRQSLANTTLKGNERIEGYRLDFYGPRDDSNEERPLVSVCIRIYKRSFLNKKQIRFRNIRSEDIDFNIRAMRDAQIISFTEFTPYCYRKDGQPSITNGMNSRMIKQYEDLVRALEECLKEERSDICAECYKRLQRGVFGYMRTLINVCALSSVSMAELVSFTKLVLGSPVLSGYLDAYPALNMSFAQRMLLHCMVYRNASVTAMLFRLRNKVAV